MTASMTARMTRVPSSQETTTGKVTPLECIAAYVPYIVGDTQGLSYDTAPLGVRMTIVDPLDKQQRTFLSLLHQLDGIAYGGKKYASKTGSEQGITDLAMPAWVMLDCAMLPSACIGLALPADAVDHYLLEQFSLPHDYHGLIPLSMFCALPTPTFESKKTMVAHTLSSLIKGLGYPTKLLGLLSYGAKEVTGVAQYDNTSVALHAKIAPLRIMHANYTFHTAQHTFIYKSYLNHARLVDMMHGAVQQPQEYDLLVKATDDAQWATIQEHIEHGAIYYITPPGQVHTHGSTFIPIQLVHPKRPD